MAGGPGGTHPRSCRCIDCGRYCTCTNCPQNTWVAYREVVSDTNNNLGRDFAACDVIHPNGRKCRYYRFKDDRQGDEPFVNSPSPDPPPSVPHWQSLGDASQILASTASQMSRPRGNLACSRPKCGKPANMKCYSSKCRAHCIQDGGCGFSDHAPKNLSTQPSLAFPVSTQPSLAFPVSTQPNLTFPLSTHPNASSTSNSTLPNTLSPSSLNTLSSNSPTFFSEVVDGRDYITDKRRTKRDAVDEAKAVSRKANTEVSVFFWVNSLVPTPCQIQGNVYDGHFTISREVLDICSFAGSSFHVYRVGMRRWLNASVDYVVKLSTMLKADGCPVLLLRDPSVTDCDGLDAILSSGASEMDWMSNPDRLKHSSRRRDFLQKLDTIELAVAAKVTAKVKKASSTSKASSSKSRTSPKHSTAKRRKASSPLLTPPSKKTTKRLKRPSPTLPSPSRTLVPFDLNQRFTASPSPDRHLIYAGPADAGSLSPNPSSPQSIISVSDHEIVVKQERDASPARFPGGTNEVIEVLDSDEEALAPIAPILDSDHESNGDIVVKQERDASPARFPGGTNEVIEVLDSDEEALAPIALIAKPVKLTIRLPPKQKAMKSVTPPSPPKAATPPPKLPKRIATKLVTPPSPPKAATPPPKLPKRKATKSVTPPSPPKAATPPPKLPKRKATKSVTPPSPPKAATPPPKLHSVDDPKFAAFLETMPDDEKEQYIEDCTTVSLLKLMGDRERKLFAFIGFSGLGLETVIKERAKNRAREEVEVVDEEIQEEVHAKSTIWPTGYHAVTIDAYFADCANPDIKRTMQSLFKEHFPHVEKYPHSSIFTHRNRWNSLSTKSREKFVAAGETEAGLWSNVMAKTTDKYQAKRNARRQAKRILDKQSREGSDDDEGEDSGGSYVDSEESVSDSD